MEAKGFYIYIYTVIFIYIYIYIYVKASEVRQNFPIWPGFIYIYIKIYLYKNSQSPSSYVSFVSSERKEEREMI